jgi:7-carboxy-7-deazaguanine synthase
MEPLRVHEILCTIQGEGSRAGLPCVLVRLAGCNLHCRWCDTPAARDAQAGRPMGIAEIVRAVTETACPRVELTGGEPLLQPAAPALLAALVEAGFETLLETNGSCDIAAVDPRVIRIVDVKCPASGEGDTFDPANLAELRAGDELKFVLAERGDYDFATALLAEHNLTERCSVLFSPVAASLAPAELARWILTDGLDVRLGLQLHKIIWPDGKEGL